MPKLLLSIRFPGGRYHGLRTDGAPDWPPPPGRLFQVLLAGAARGADLPEEAAATLGWLETCDAPVIAAPVEREGARTTLMVPNNDLDAVSGVETVAGDPAGLIRQKDGTWQPASASIRTAKTFRPVLFDPAVPVLYLWRIAAEDEGRAPRVMRRRW